MSAEEILGDVKKLHLDRGDILVLGPKAAQWFASLPPQVIQDFVQSVPDVQVILGDATKLTRTDLLRLLENMPI